MLEAAAGVCTRLLIRRPRYTQHTHRFLSCFFVGKLARARLYISDYSFVPVALRNVQLMTLCVPTREVPLVMRVVSYKAPQKYST